MKAIIFYLTVVLSMILLCMEFSFIWAILALIDAILFEWCYSHISGREFCKYSGYSAWYRYLN